MNKWGNFVKSVLNILVPNTRTDKDDWIEDAQLAIAQQDPIKTRLTLYLIFITLIVLIIWSSYAEVDEVTRGLGKVIPSQQIQIIQSVDGGILEEINVSEGSIVTEGALLFRLDQTRFASTLREKEAEYYSLQLRSIRLNAISNGTPLFIPKKLEEAAPSITAQERELYQKSVDEIAGQKNIAQQQLEQRLQELEEVQAKLKQQKESFILAEQEYKLTQPLADSGAVSDVELIQLQKEVTKLRGDVAQSQAQEQRILASISEAEQKVIDVELSYKNELRKELSQVSGQLNALKEVNLGLSDKVKQTDIYSPVRGTVKKVYFNTLGGVVMPGKEMVEIVPLDDTLLLETKINPKDIGFLRPKAKALVKFTAYDFVVYGGLTATVESIGADTLMDEEGKPYYNVRIRTEQPHFSEDKPIIPGMMAEVDILTGKKTVLNYLLKPVLRAKQYAFSER